MGTNGLNESGDKYKVVPRIKVYATELWRHVAASAEISKAMWST